MSDPRDFQRLIGDVIRLGTIASVDLASATCTVKVGNLETAAVPWLVQRAGGTAAWSPPTIGEQCVLLCPEGDTAAGVAIGGLYSDANPAPASAEKMELLRFADGAEISYDAAAHKLSAILPGGATAEVVAPGGITLKGKVRIEGDVELTGTMNADGDVKAGGDVRAGAISLAQHRHSGVVSGSSITQGPL